MRRLSEIHEVPLFVDGAGKDQQIFWALHLISKSVPHARREIGAAYAVIETAVLHRQIRFFFNPRDEPVAFVTWAMVEVDVHQRLMTGKCVHLHKSEWNEGRLLWLMDFVAPFGHGRAVALKLLRQMSQAGEQEFVHFVRRRTSGNEIRVIKFTRENHESH